MEILYMFIVCIITLMLIPARKFNRIKCAIFIFVLILGAVMFNNVVEEAYQHYNSYRYLFLIAGIYSIFINYYHIYKDKSFKYVSFLTSLCTGYLFIILFFSISNLYQIVRSFNNKSLMYYIVELYQSFIMTTLSFFICEVVSRFTHLFYIYINSKYDILQLLDRYMMIHNFFPMKDYVIKDLSNNFYIIKDNIKYLLKNVYKLLNRHSSQIFVKSIIVIIIASISMMSYSQKPIYMLRDQIFYNNKSWNEKIIVKQYGNLHLYRKTNLRGVYKIIDSKNISYSSARKNFKIKGNKLHIKNINYNRRILDKLRNISLHFDSVKGNEYHLIGHGKIDYSKNFSSKVNIGLYLTN